MTTPAETENLQSPTTDQAVRSHLERADLWLNASFEPDTMMPVQFYDLIRRSPRLDGEMRLLFAVLEDAIRTYLQGGNSRWHGGREAYYEVRNWFESRHDRGLFSFAQVCDVLNIEPESLRTQLRTMKLGDLPSKQMRSVGRRHVVRSVRRWSKLKRSSPRTSHPLNLAAHPQ